MTDSGPGLQPSPSVSVPDVPGVGQAAPVSAPVVPQVPQPVADAGRAPRSKAWIWWLVAVVVVLGSVFGACAAMFAWFGESSGGSGFGDSIAIIWVDDAISGTGSYVTPESFYDEFSQALEDEAVKAIVLRVDSPGGTVAASEEIAAYVAASDKPVVVSIGDIGASGAYMISSQADEIWAMDGSSVGGIGVISQIPNVSGLIDKAGIEFQVVTAGKYKDAGSPYRALTKEERALIQGEVDEAYDQFIDIVARGRSLPPAQVEEMATGWVWSGRKALEMKLIDKVGTFEDAKDAAAKLGGIDGEYGEVSYRDQFDDVFSELMGLTSSLSGLGAASGDAASGLRQTVPR